MNITDVFKQFQKDRHNEDKGKYYNLLQEVFSKTELFDLSKLKLNKADCNIIEVNNNVYADSEKDIKNLNIPFECLFIKVEDRQYFISNKLEEINTYAFIREYSPSVITGTIYSITNNTRRNMPFTYYIEVGELLFDLDGYNNANPKGYNVPYYTKQELMILILNILSTLNTLSDHKVMEDRLSTEKHEYFRRKGKPTIKVSVRPIYYVLDKQDTTSAKSIKPRGTLEYSQLFIVRGHWRKVDSDTLGKDRLGNRNVKGYTWVVEHFKGNGELVKKIRIVK